MTWHLVTTDFPPDDGGVATWSWLVASALTDAGEDVLVHARTVPEAPFRILRMQGRSWRRWQHVWAAVSVLPRLRVGDRLLCATWPLAVKLLLPARRLGVPVGVAYHGSDLTRPPVITGFEAVRKHAVHLPVSDFLGGLLGAPFVRLPAPIDLMPPTPRGESLLTIARLVPLKGVDRVLRLGARVGLPVVVVGDGPDRTMLERLAGELGVSATFTGRLDRQAIPWQQARAVCLFSRSDLDGSGAEGLGLVLLEAAARGIPTLGTRVGGIPEAADVVMDPEFDALPALRPPAPIQERFARANGTDRCVFTLRTALGTA